MFSIVLISFAFAVNVLVSVVRFCSAISRASGVGALSNTICAVNTALDTTLNAFISDASTSWIAGNFAIFIVTFFSKATATPISAITCASSSAITTTASALAPAVLVSVVSFFSAIIRAADVGALSTALCAAITAIDATLNAFISDARTVRPIRNPAIAALASAITACVSAAICAAAVCAFCSCVCAKAIREKKSINIIKISFFPFPKYIALYPFLTYCAARRWCCSGSSW